MTGDTSGRGAPLSDEVLADLHAGVLDEETSANRWAEVQHDERAQEVLAALDATTAQLGRLAAEPAPEMPEHVADRIDTALATESGSTESGSTEQQSEPAPVVDINTARRKRNRILAAAAGVVTTAAAAIVAITIVVPGGTTGGAPHAAAPDSTHDGSATPSGLTLHSGELGQAVGSVVGKRELGPLENQQQLYRCLEANDIDPDRKPVGIRPGTIDGETAVIVLYPTGEYAQYRLIALAPDCGKDDPGTLKDTTIGRGSDEGGG